MLKYFKKLQRELKKYLDPQYMPLVIRAYEVAYEAHLPQKRQTGEPYITHPVAVATILAKMQLDYQTIIAALLHDVLEDTDVTKGELGQEFGSEVADLVDGVSKLTQIKFATREHAQAENFRKMIMAMSKDIRVIIVKLADRLHNMRTLGPLSLSKLRRIVKETLDIYAPIAQRLGMHAFRVEYDELGFAALHPMRCRVLKKALKKAKGNRKGIVSEVEQSLRSHLEKWGVEIQALMGREKHVYSIFKKMRDKNLSFLEIMDIYGFRVIVNNLDDCYRVLGALHNLYKPLQQRFKDYIAIPKANGYQSLHTTLFGPYGVPLELQIRTVEMDQMAENGIAAHWLYKADQDNSNSAHIRAKEWVQSILELQQSAGNSLEFIENVKIELFPDEVYVFTPKGSILELPSRATAVDFAYAVHSDIGNTCIAAKVNRRLVPLSTKLKSGQTVEVITAPSGRPNPAWLSFVVTGKAKSNIRHFLKSQKYEESIKLGKRLLLKSVVELMPDISKIPDDAMEEVLARLNIKTDDELYEQVGLGARVAAVVAQQFQQVMEPIQVNVEQRPEEENSPLEISGTEGVVLHYANCCQPIPGDPIVGFITPGKGMDVHVGYCPSLSSARREHSEYLVSLAWEDNIDTSLPVNVVLDAVENKPGLLASIVTALSESGTNIKHIAATEGGTEYCQVHLVILVKNTEQLSKILHRLQRIDGIVQAQRGLDVESDDKKGY